MPVVTTTYGLIAGERLQRITVIHFHLHKLLQYEHLISIYICTFESNMSFYN
jgi:hypothetical protein